MNVDAIWCVCEKSTGELVAGRAPLFLTLEDANRFVGTFCVANKVYVDRVFTKPDPTPKSGDSIADIISRGEANRPAGDTIAAMQMHIDCLNRFIDVQAKEIAFLSRHTDTLMGFVEKLNRLDHNNRETS